MLIPLLQYSKSSIREPFHFWSSPWAWLRLCCHASQFNSPHPIRLSSLAYRSLFQQVTLTNLWFRVCFQEAHLQMFVPGIVLASGIQCRILELDHWSGGNEDPIIGGSLLICGAIAKMCLVVNRDGVLVEGNSLADAIPQQSRGSGKVNFFRIMELDGGWLEISSYWEKERLRVINHQFQMKCEKQSQPTCLEACEEILISCSQRAENSQHQI